MRLTPKFALAFLIVLVLVVGVAMSDVVPPLTTAVWQAPVLARLSTPPLPVQNGARYLVTSPASGGWLGMDGQIVSFSQS